VFFDLSGLLSSSITGAVLLERFSCVGSYPTPRFTHPPAFDGLYSELGFSYKGRKNSQVIIGSGLRLSNKRIFALVLSIGYSLYGGLN